jgi:hypothetical protein
VAAIAAGGVAGRAAAEVVAADVDRAVADAVATADRGTKK